MKTDWRWVFMVCAAESKAAREAELLARSRKTVLESVTGTRISLPISFH
jgi:hypothetical protein